MFVNKPRARYQPGCYAISFLFSLNNTCEGTEVLYTSVCAGTKEYVVNLMTKQFVAWLEAHVVKALQEAGLSVLVYIVKCRYGLCYSYAHSGVGSVSDAWLYILAVEVEFLVKYGVITTLQCLPVFHSLVPFGTFWGILPTLDVLECGFIGSDEATTCSHFYGQVAEGQTTFH